MSINDIQFGNKAIHQLKSPVLFGESYFDENHYAECHYVECHYAECCGAKKVLPVARLRFRPSLKLQF